MIRFNCEHCNKAISIPDSSAGKKGKCVACGKSITAPVSAPQYTLPAAFEPPAVTEPASCYPPFEPLVIPQEIPSLPQPLPVTTSTSQPRAFTIPQYVQPSAARSDPAPPLKTRFKIPRHAGWAIGVAVFVIVSLLFFGRNKPDVVSVPPAQFQPSAVSRIVANEPEDDDSPRYLAGELPPEPCTKPILKPNAPKLMRQVGHLMFTEFRQTDKGDGSRTFMARKDGLGVRVTTCGDGVTQIILTGPTSSKADKDATLALIAKVLAAAKIFDPDNRILVASFECINEGTNTSVRRLVVDDCAISITFVVAFLITIKPL